ncbi:MAG: ABC transporter permease subunit [Caldilineaceae bacterium]
MRAMNYPIVDAGEKRLRLPTYGLALLLLLLVAIGWRFLAPESVLSRTLASGVTGSLDAFQSWVIGNRATHPLFVYGFRPFSEFVERTLRTLEAFLLWLPWPVHFILLYAIGYKAGGHRLGLLTTAGLLLMGLFGLWQASMETLALMGVAVTVTLLIGIPLGIWAARHARFEALLRPVLDAMQTMPAFVYLIPVVLFFGIARTPSVIATVIYALPPAIRLTTLGIRQVPGEAIEAADAFGSTAGQKLRKVQLPLALPSILLGVNQSIMMALGIVVIAALIGARGLGQEVLEGLQRLRVGQALEAGLAIVLMAVIFDRISYGFSRNNRQSAIVSGGLRPLRQRQSSPPTHLFENVQQNVPALLLNYVYWSAVLVVILALVIVDMDSGLLRGFPEGWQLSMREPVDGAVRWLRDNLYQIGDLPIGTGPFSDFVVLNLLNPLRNFFTTILPWPLVVALFGILGHHAGGWRLALFTMASIVTLGLLGMWQESMDTLSQVLVAVVFTVVLGIPLGIWAARNDLVEAILRPILDFLQTIPQFVYLVPVIMLFNVGRVPGLIASVFYALPAIVRLTNLGIRQVPAATIEAADVFGSTARQKLLKVQLPLARSSIMLGVEPNQWSIIGAGDVVISLPGWSAAGC